VEDEGDLRELMAKTLQESGYDVGACDTGRTVLSAAAEFKPDLILLDIMLPGVDGLALAQQMSEDPVLSKIPVIAVSALENTRKQLEMLPQTCGFISKPFSMSVLVAKIKEVLAPR